MNPLHQKYPIKQCAHNSIVAVSKRFSKTLTQYHNELLELLWNKKNTLSATARIQALESAELIDGLHKGWEARTSIAYNTPDHLTMAMMEFNLLEFSASKTEARLASLKELLVEGDKIKSFSDFKQAAEKITKDFNSTYLETEYNLTIASAQGAAQQIRFLAEKDSVTNLVMYQTAGDSKVRSEHAVLDGLVFDLNDPGVMTIWTPNGFGCRCEYLQHFGNESTIITKSSAAKNLLGEKFKGSAFDNDMLKSKKVFKEETYYSKINKIASSLNKMSYDQTYGQESYSVFKERLNSLKLDASITKTNVAELFKKEGVSNKSPFMGFTDYLKRKLILKKSVFDNNTKTTTNAQMFPHVETVLQNPDEVWIYGYNKKESTFLTRYIKYWNNESIITHIAVGDNHLEINGWQKMKNENSKRKGLLMYNTIKS